MGKSKGKVQITIDVSDNPALRKAFWIAADELEIQRSRLGRTFIELGLWIKSKLNLEVSKLCEKYFPLFSLSAAAVQLKELGFPKAEQLEKLVDEARVFLESRGEPEK